MKTTLTACLCALALCTPIAQADVYEMRTYTANEGRLDALLAMFEKHIVGLFEKHGMKNVAYFVPQDEDLAGNTLIYILAHEDRDAAAASWRGFVSDPGFAAARAEFDSDGENVKEIVSVYMDTTPWSPTP